MLVDKEGSYVAYEFVVMMHWNSGVCCGHGR